MTVETEVSYLHDAADSDSDVEDKKGHTKLLSAISRLDRKQRVKPPSRKESSVQVSEFHLTKQKKSDKNAVNLKELAVVLGKGASSHVAISKKLQEVQKKAKPLAKPLERIVADKVKRQAGFTQAKELLDRWDDVVRSNQVADKLEFPMIKNKMKVRETNIFLTAANPKTELEKEIYKALKQSKDLNEEEKQKEEDTFPMTLKEVLDQRRESGRLKAQTTQQQIKTWKQNKSKSKKYHRILKKERLRKEIKEFELLKETNPEEALRRLDQLERSRAQERASLRHKNTGHWAQNKAIRAKYDRECRQNLAEQLSIGRELSQKVQIESDSSDSEGEASDLIIAPDLAPNNPLEEDVSQFVAGYRKYWEQKKVPVKGPTTQLLANNKLENNTKQLQVLGKRSEVNSPDLTPKKKKLKGNATEDDDIVELDFSSDLPPVSEHSNVVKKSSKAKKTAKVKKPKSKKLKQKLGDDIIEEEPGLDIKKRPQKCGSKSLKAKGLNDSWAVTNIENENKKNKKAKSIKKSKKSNSNIDSTDLFDSVEKVQDRLLNKALQRLKKSEEQENPTQEKIQTTKGKTATKKTKKQKKNKNSSSVAAEKVIKSLRNNEETRKHVNHPLEEQAVGVDDTSSSVNEVQSLLNISEREVKEQVTRLQSDIDPSKFLAARPLKSHRAELVLTGLEDLDDMEQDEEERQRVALAEAFADDDVVDAFRNEKEDMIKASKAKDVDLTLPGWGEWTGAGTHISVRKRKRFILKPTVEPPRKDRNKHNVILYEGKSSGIENHQVSALPYPYTSVKDFEASLRAPIGTTWIPETAHRKLTAPRVVTHQGQIIKPMNEDALLGTDAKKKQKQ